MISQILGCRSKCVSEGLISSQLLNEKTFYPAFLNDVKRCRCELIIESPFIASRRVNKLLPVFCNLSRRGVKIIVNTRDPNEHEERMHHEAQRAIAALQDIGVEVLYTGGHHRKLVIIDRAILYEGSLNVLSQNESCKIMRRIDSEVLTRQTIDVIGIGRFLDGL